MVFDADLGRRPPLRPKGADEPTSRERASGTLRPQRDADQWLFETSNTGQALREMVTQHPLSLAADCSSGPRALIARHEAESVGLLVARC